jgi:hypothetical protein
MCRARNTAMRQIALKNSATYRSKLHSDAEYEAQQRQSSVTLLAPDECTLAGNRELFYRAIENVVRNAIRYTEPGAGVEISLTAPETNGGHVIELKVNDSGPGIPENEVKEIFRPFYRIDRARSLETGGFGVGLAIAERTVKLHGGELSASSRPGGGLHRPNDFPAAGSSCRPLLCLNGRDSYLTSAERPLGRVAGLSATWIGPDGQRIMMTSRPRDAIGFPSLTWNKPRFRPASTSTRFRALALRFA